MYTSRCKIKAKKCKNARFFYYFTLNYKIQGNDQVPKVMRNKTEIKLKIEIWIPNNQKTLNGENKINFMIQKF